MTMTIVNVDVDVNRICDDLSLVTVTLKIFGWKIFKKTKMMGYEK